MVIFPLKNLKFLFCHKNLYNRFIYNFDFHPLHSFLSTGNFVDLVNKKWYDGMSLQKVEQLTVQTGKPAGGEGYIDPKTKGVRGQALVLRAKRVFEGS